MQVSKLSVRVKSVVRVQHEEREGHLSAKVKKFTSGVAPVSGMGGMGGMGGPYAPAAPPGAAPAASTGPKLKDYLNAGR